MSTMFERFTDRARRVVVNAQEESRARNHVHIGSEHLLLGLLRDDDGLAVRVLVSLGVSQDAVRLHLEEAMHPGDRPPSGHLPFGSDAKRVLELALQEAKALGHNYIGTEHVLLGLVHEGDSLAALVLSKLGIDLEHTRAEVRRLMGGAGQVSEARATDRLARLEQQVAILGERLAAVEHRLGGREAGQR